MASFRPFPDTLAGKTFHSREPQFCTSIKKLFHRYFLDFRQKIARVSNFFRHDTSCVKQSTLKTVPRNLAGTPDAAPLPKAKAPARQRGGKQPCFESGEAPVIFLNFPMVDEEYVCTVRFGPVRGSGMLTRGGVMPARALAHVQPGWRNGYRPQVNRSPSGQ